MSGKTKILALLLLGLGLIFMVMAFLSGQNVRKGGEAIKTELERFPVVVSNQEITFGTPITPEMLKVDKFAIAPKGAFTDIGDVIGKKPLFTVSKGLPVTSQYFESGAVAAEVREGFRAFALRLDENNMATGKIKAGDHVDVFSIFKANSRDIEQTISRLVMPNLRVLSVGSQLVNSPDTNPQEEKDVNNRQTRQRAMMVEVPTADINTLAVAQTLGELFVVLRGPEEEELPDMSKFPQSEPILKPVLVKGPDGKVLNPQPKIELNASDKAFAGISLNNAILPGSGNGQNKNKAPQTTTQRESAPATVEVIRGGETTRETAR